MAGVALLEHGPHSPYDPFSFVCRRIIAGSYEFKEGRASESGWSVGVGINESWPRTITRHEGRKSVTGPDKLPLDLWRQPLELSVHVTADGE